jgi:hypothetical protein
MTHNPVESQNPDDAETTDAQASKSSVKGWLKPRTAISWFTPELDIENEFPQEQKALVQKLLTDSPEQAADLLEEAREIAAAIVRDRVEGVERRATTMQGVVAITATFTLTGGGLIVTQIRGTLWQIAIGGLLFLITLSLALCGFRATQAVANIHRWRAAPRNRVLSRAGQALTESRAERAAYELRVAGVNSRIARFKVTMLNRARGHLLRALAGVPLLTGLLLAYAVANDPVGDAAQSSATPPSASAPASRRSTPSSSEPAAKHAGHQRHPSKSTPSTVPGPPASHRREPSSTRPATAP